jgi:transketolase
MLEKINDKRLSFGPRRAIYMEAASLASSFSLPTEERILLEDFDLIYRTLCGILYNFAPTSGHPGGSISSGRIVAGLLYYNMDYLINDPKCLEADILSYAAGHKAMGLYAMWGLRNECVRISCPDLLPDESKQLRLEDLLGFRKNPTQDTPLFRLYKSKPLDGHPTPQTPFVKLATGASGVGVPASLGLAFGALDTFGSAAPLVHILEGEGGMTAGRVSEALAVASSAQLWNAKIHVDWNQASIDSEHVCREGEVSGEYVQWTPVELCYLHDWNVIFVNDGNDFQQILAAQELAKERLNDQPTAVVYRTIKGWQYGIEGRKSHGAGHVFCSEAYYEMLRPMEQSFGIRFPRFEGEVTPARVERTFYDSLLAVRQALESKRSISDLIGAKVSDAKRRLISRERRPRQNASRLEILYKDSIQPEAVPAKLIYEPGQRVTLREALGMTLSELNQATNGAFIAGSADLLGSTSVIKIGQGFPAGFYNATTNPEARLVAMGGICEDCMGAFMSGLASYGRHIGVGSSYGAFIAALQHIAARLHGIGQQARRSSLGDPFNTFIIVCAHAGLKTGEDGPTHADPQALQLVQENFPQGIAVTLTPWDPRELWPLIVEALHKRPAVLIPFVTRPQETIFDREEAKLPPPTEAIKGLYALREADRQARHYHGTLVLQGSEVCNTFVSEVLPRMDREGLNMNVYYVASAELFSLLDPQEQAAIYTPEQAAEAIGITGFTLSTMYRWVTTPEGRARTLHAFKQGRYPGSGQASKVLEEAGLDGEAQWKAIWDYARWRQDRTL